jgi:catechol 2,3-dioxygenase-like lactoylglutathione lyase family enzyme
MKVIAGATVLLVADVPASADYYRDALGFSYERFWGDPPDFCMVWRDQQCVMLSGAPEPELIRPVSTVKPAVWDAYFWVQGLDELFEDLRARGARIGHEPLLKPYGVREIVALDLDGHQLAFGEEET